MKICIVSSIAAAFEPRAPRHAIAAKRAFPDAEVVFLTLLPAGRPTPPNPFLFQGEDIQLLTVEFPSRESGVHRLAARKIGTRFDQALFTMTGIISEGFFGARVRGLTQALKRLSADVYIAHNIDTLLPAMDAAVGRSSIIFDCMEYYSDMGDAQSKIEARAAHVLEAKCLPKCALVIASSDILADALEAEYGIRRPFPSYNVPPIRQEMPSRLGGGLNLYWRNNVIDFGQRGLDDALLALRRLPSDVRLFLQGRTGIDGGKAISARAITLGVESRVRILPPYAPQDAVFEAAKYDVGLCLERKGPRNHDLTVSNKMFDYHMAGLATISSDLPSLRLVIDRSRGGLVYEPGNPESLANAIQQLHSSPMLLANLKENARRFALEEANLEKEIERLAIAIHKAIKNY